jgi:hypothetical protein
MLALFLRLYLCTWRLCMLIGFLFGFMVFTMYNAELTSYLTRYKAELTSYLTRYKAELTSYLTLYIAELTLLPHQVQR